MGSAVLTTISYLSNLIDALRWQRENRVIQLLDDIWKCQAKH